MQVPTPAWSRPLLGTVVTRSRRGPALVALRKPPAETELRALLTALRDVKPDDQTQCTDWSAHDLLAHLAAGSREMAELLESPTGRETRDFVEREEPYRRMGDKKLRQAFVVEGLRLVSAIEARRDPVLFTGAELTVDQIVTHARSELVLHRFDFTGGDETDWAALADPALITHALTVVASMDAGVLPTPRQPQGRAPSLPLARTLGTPPSGSLAPEIGRIAAQPCKDPEMSADLGESLIEFQRCIAERDVPAADRILDAEYALMLVLPVAAVVPKERWLATLPEYVVHSYDVQEQLIDIDGDTAAVLHRADMHATVSGADRSGIFIVSDIWRLRDGQWRIWKRHSTPLSAGKLTD